MRFPTARFAATLVVSTQQMGGAKRERQLDNHAAGDAHNAEPK